MFKFYTIQSNEILGGAELTEKFQSNLRAGLENINVELHLGERVTNLDELSFAVYKRQTVKTSKVIMKFYRLETWARLHRSSFEG